MTEKTFQKLLLEAVDEAFSSLGDSAKQSIYFHLEDKFNITRNEIPVRVEDFEEGLEKIFGKGTRFLEILIMRKLHERMQPKSGILRWDQDKEFKFVDYVKAAEQSYSERKRQTRSVKV